MKFSKTPRGVQKLPGCLASICDGCFTGSENSILKCNFVPVNKNALHLPISHSSLHPAPLLRTNHRWLSLRSVTRETTDLPQSLWRQPFICPASEYPWHQQGPVSKTQRRLTKKFAFPIRLRVHSGAIQILSGAHQPHLSGLPAQRGSLCVIGSEEPARASVTRKASLWIQRHLKL